MAFSGWGIRARAIAVSLVTGLAIQSAIAQPPGVVFDVDLWMLQEDDRPLFIYGRDTVPGQSTCVDACAKLWATFEAAPDATPIYGWTIETQADGRRLWAYEGKPVYRLIDPERTGYGASSALWTMARVTQWRPPGIVADAERVFRLADGGRIGTPAQGKCEAACQAHWLPLRPEPGAVGWQYWSVVDAPDGGKMWAYQDPPFRLYVVNPASPPPVPKAEPGKLPVVAMNEMLETRMYPAVDPIAVTEGSIDLHDPSVTKAPELAPGWKAPVYPSASLRAAESGFVALQFCIDAQGRVTEQKLGRASDFPRLNDATLAWGSTLVFTPGEVDGKPAPTCGYTIDFQWKIRS